MKLRNVVIIVVVVAAAAGGYAFYRQRNAKTTQAKYRTETIDRGNVAATVTATGTISAVTTVQVGSQVSGIIQSLYADYNSPVKKGQLLATLDPTPFKLQVQQREADLQQANVQMRNAEVQFNRNARLLQEQLVPQADYDTAKANFDSMKAQVDQADAALQQARTNLSYTNIYSPIDGVVVARQYDIGQTVAASFQAPTLFTIAEDLTKMQVQADVDQSDISRVTTGQSARFSVDAYPEEPFVGAISQIRLNATQNSNVITYPVIIDVPNPDGKLKPKMTADVTIEVARVQDVLRVPNAALRFKPIETGRGGANDPAAKAALDGTAARGRGATGDPGPRGGGGGGGGALAGAADALAAGQRGGRHRQVVYIVGPNEELKEVEVKTGITDGRFTAVTEGDLKAGDKIAVGFATAKVDGQGTLPPGMGGPRPGGGPGGGRRP
jgi:HlyD family secretion protein